MGQSETNTEKAGFEGMGYSYTMSLIQDKDKMVMHQDMRP